MSRASALKYRFPNSVTVHLGGKARFPDQATFEAQHGALLEEILAVLARAGREAPDADLGLQRTGGHADITYFSARYGDDDGGAEVVLYEVDWGGGYQPLSPWIRLFGAWTAHRTLIEDALGASRRTPEHGSP